MTDEELIAQLRNSKGWPTLGNAAADRIEALERDAKAHEKEIAVWSENYAAMERKLEAARADTEKAVEALREIADAFGCECGDAARATLAEIEGTNAP